MLLGIYDEKDFLAPERLMGKLFVGQFCVHTINCDIKLNNATAKNDIFILFFIVIPHLNLSILDYSST